MSGHEQKAREFLRSQGIDGNFMVQPLVSLLASVELEARAREPYATEIDLVARVAELERERDEWMRRAENASFPRTPLNEVEKRVVRERDSARALNARLREALEGVERHCAEALACETCHPINHCPILDNVRKTLAESASDASDWTRE